MQIPYYHVDAFTDHVFGGNPAGVCFLEHFLAPAVMQNMAAENRHSETAFVVGRPGGGYDLRWFTPEVEDDLCGHATLASAHVLWLRGQTAWPVHFHTCAGVLTVERKDARYEMDFPARPPEPCPAPPALLPALGVTAAVMVMKSVRDYLVVLDHHEEVRRISPDIQALLHLDLGLGGVIVTAPGNDADYVVRFFPPAVGISEDPATGSIQCTLAPYWSQHLGKTDFYSRQLSRRGGEIWATFDRDRVRISGNARLYLQGTISI